MTLYPVYFFDSLEGDRGKYVCKGSQRCFEEEFFERKWNSQCGHQHTVGSPLSILFQVFSFALLHFSSWKPKQMLVPRKALLHPPALGEQPFREGFDGTGGTPCLCRNKETPNPQPFPQTVLMLLCASCIWLWARWNLNWNLALCECINQQQTKCFFFGEETPRGKWYWTGG